MALFLLGILGLLAEAFILTGRAPHITLMRGGGPLSFALLAAAAAVFIGALAFGWRRLAARRRVATILAVIAVLGAVAAVGIAVRQPLPGADEYRLTAAEIGVARALLGATACLFAALWLWPGVSAAVATVRAQGVHGPRMAQALLRLGWTRFGAPLKAVAVNLALTLCAIVVTAMAGEIAIRWARGVPLLAFENLVTRRTDLLTNHGANRFDPLLGWVLADHQGADTNGVFSTGDHGVRMNGRTTGPVPHHAIVAVGDSFTAGSEVRNWESWPAQLEALIGEPVVNAATGGWGSDQIVLRAESLISALEPKAIIVSFLADDIVRAGNETYGGGNKPYFTVLDSALVPHNIPVPRFVGSVREIGWLRGFLGYSELVAYVMQATGRYEWWFGDIFRRVANDPAEVSCLLLQRLKAQTDAGHTPLFFVMQYATNLIMPLDAEPAYAKRVLTCARRLDIPTTNLWADLRAVYQRDPTGMDGLYNIDQRHQFGHMSAKGNALVARLIADAIREIGTRPR